MDNLQICLASNIKKYRKELHLSQEKLAEKANASANYIALIENGKYFPSLPMIQQIAKALNIEALDLFDRRTLEYQDLDKLRLKIIENLTDSVNSVFTDEISKHNN
ncbi:MAG: helix-turn-helix transcriptional regulator [Treponema sp.]|nr:helix-turn-helix transcriptional regulator [Treponema sp.]